MHKNKDGKVTASLTEVKNRTGDIFALVDEFGEVYLTSYNKVRYKISKTDISNFIELKDTPTKADRKEVVKKALVRQEKPVVKTEVKTKAAPAPVKKEEAPTSDNLLSKISKVLPWDRNNKLEQDFANNAKSPLVSN